MVAPTIALEVLVGLAFVASGLVARVRRPENRTGLLMILVGLSWFGGALQASNASLPYTLGYAGGALSPRSLSTCARVPERAACDEGRAAA